MKKGCHFCLQLMNDLLKEQTVQVAHKVMHLVTVTRSQQYTNGCSFSIYDDSALKYNRNMWN